MTTKSPIEKFTFRGVSYLIKRDDLLDKDFSGNKARKFSYFLQNPPKNITKIISFGSNQSNAMYSLSVLAKKLKVRFIYICHHIPSNLKKNPIGNYKNALKNGMEIQTNENAQDYAKSLITQNSLFINEGGALKEASFGIKTLAEEIKSQTDKKYDIFLPSGTGTTALYLQKYIDYNVFTCPCVGDKEYLKKQFLQLEKSNHPIILNPPKKYHFGQIKKELFDIWHELKTQTNIEFDLLYDPIGWLTLLLHLDKFKNPILYIHQGGLLGNTSLLERYKYKKIF